jgi:hypothetical protein
MARVISVVLDREFGDALEPLAFRNPVWIIESEANTAASEAAWHRATEWPQISVTVFRDEPRTKDDWAYLIDQLELHHGPFSQRSRYDTLQVIGRLLTADIRAAMHEAGFDRVEETRDGFRASEHSKG